MAENENIAVEAAKADEAVTSKQVTPPPAEDRKEGFGAKVKEFFRKKGVALKRKPQNIAFLFLCIITVYNLITLVNYSEAIIDYAKDVPWTGLMVFITTLFSILILVAYLNTFPKLRKPKSKTTFTMVESGVKLNINIPMLVLVIVMAVAMIVCDAMYFKLMYPFYLDEYVNKPSSSVSAMLLIKKTLNMSIAHIILLGIFLVLLLTLPLYRKLIMKINTSKVIEGNEMKEVIDTED